MSGRGRARGRARGAPSSQPEPARRPGETGAAVPPPGRGRARGIRPTAAAAAAVAAAPAEPPTQEMARMGIAAAAVPPDRTGERRQPRERREQREPRDRRRRDDLDYDPMRTRPENRDNKRGEMGQQVDIVANYFALRTLPEWRVYQYNVQYNPDIISMGMRRGMLREHERALLGRTIAFDGMILYLPKRLPSDVTTLTSIRTSDQEPIQITITLTNELPPSSPQCLQMFNVIFRR